MVNRRVGVKDVVVFQLSLEQYFLFNPLETGNTWMYS